MIDETKEMVHCMQTRTSTMNASKATTNAFKSSKAKKTKVGALTNGKIIIVRPRNTHVVDPITTPRKNIIMNDTPRIITVAQRRHAVNDEGCGLSPTIDDYKLALRAHGPLTVVIPDRLWQGSEHEHGSRTYVITDVKDANGLYWLARETSPTGRVQRTSKQWMVPTRLLLDPATQVSWNRKAYERMLLPERHHFASIRATAIAGILGPTAIHDNNAYIITLDTPGRNIEAMVRAGWQRERILVFEMCEDHVIYLRLSGRVPPENVIYTPNRWETYALENRASLDPRLRKAVIFYADYYGGPTSDFHQALACLPCLRAYSVCGQPRRVKNATANPGGQEAFETPLSGFKRSCTMSEGRMITNTFVHKATLESSVSPVRLC